MILSLLFRFFFQMCNKKRQQQITDIGNLLFFIKKHYFEKKTIFFSKIPSQKFPVCRPLALSLSLLPDISLLHKKWNFFVCLKKTTKTQFILPSKGVTDRILSLSSLCFLLLDICWTILPSPSVTNEQTDEQTNRSKNIGLAS